jgi:uncharacterized SAM-binding protein YcdF (DUF218 family)
VHQTTTSHEIARLTPRFRDLFACCIDLGYSAANTMGNAAETRRWLRQKQIGKSLIVVTSNYHMPRALAELGGALPDVALIPYPVVSDRVKHADWWRDAKILRLFASEYMKYLFARVRIQLIPPLEDRDAEGFTLARPEPQRR